MIPHPGPRSRPWLVVALLWVVVFSNFFTRLLPTTMHGSLVAAIPMTETQFGLLTAALLWTYGLTSPFAGLMADRIGRTPMIITSMFLWSTITWLTSYARTFEELLVLRLLMGASEACYLPAALALISDYHKGRTRSFATGIHESGYTLGIGLSGLGGWLAERRSWHYAFSVVGLAGVAYCVLLLFFLRDAPQESPRAGAGPGPESGPSSGPQPGRDAAQGRVRVGEALVSLFSHGSFYLILVTASLRGVGAWTVLGWAPLFLQEHFHLSQGIAGISATGYMNAAAVPGLLIGGAWADKWSRTNRRGRMYVVAIGLLVAAPGLLLTANTNVLVLAVLGLVVYRLFTLFSDANLMPVLCEIVDPRYRATSYGVHNLVTSLAAGSGIYFSGVLRDGSVDLRVVFGIAAGVSAVCAVLFYFIKPEPAVGR